MGKTVSATTLGGLCDLPSMVAGDDDSRGQKGQGGLEDLPNIRDEENHLVGTSVVKDSLHSVNLAKTVFLLHP